MDERERDQAVMSLGRVLAHLIALLVAPTVCGIVPWFIMSHAERDPVSNAVSATTHIVMGSVPMIGAVLAVGYAGWVRRPRYLLPLLPFIFAATAFLIAEVMIGLADDENGELEGTTNWYPDAEVVSLVCWMVQPVLALVGGCIAIVSPSGMSGGAATLSAGSARDRGLRS